MSATVASRPRVRRVPRPRPQRAHAVPRALVLRERARGRGRAPPPRAARGVGRARERARALRRAARTARRSHRVAPGGRARCASAGSWAASSSRRPSDDLRWGRRVCAAAVERGVLLRPLGDVVVLMPPLTITSPELHRIVHTLADALDAGTARSMSWHDWADHEAKRVHDAEPVARTARPRPRRGAEARRRRRRPPRRVVRVERLPRSHPSSRGRRRRPRRARPLGHRFGLGAPDRRLAAGALRARGRARRVEAHRARGAVHHRLRRQPRRAHHVRGARRARVLRRAEPRVDHRRPAARGRAARGLPPSRRRARRRDPVRVRPSRARSSSRRRCSRWTATSRRSRELAEVCARHGALLVLDEAHAVLAAGARAPRRRRRAARRHAVEDARRARRVRRRARALHRSRGEPRPLLHLHHRVDAGRHRRRARRARGRCDRPKATSSAPACAPTSTGCGRTTRRRSCPYVCGSEQRALEVAAALLDDGLLVTADPPADGAAGHVAAARHAVGRAHRRAGRPARARARARTSPRDPTRTLLVVRRRHGHRGRQDVVDRRGRAGSCARDGVAVAARKPVQSVGARRTARRRRARRRHRRRPRHRVSRAPHATTSRGHRRWPPTSWGCRRSRSTTSRPSSPGPTVSRSASSKASAGLAPRSRPTATTSTSHACSQPDLVVLVADAGLGTINAVRLSARRVRRLPADRGAEPLRRRPTPRPQPRLPRRATPDLDVVTAPAQLAARLRRRSSRSLLRAGIPGS